MSGSQTQRLIADAEKGIGKYLADALASGEIDQQSHDQALRNTLPALKKRLEDDYVSELSPSLKEGISDAITDRKWEELVKDYGAFGYVLPAGTLKTVKKDHSIIQNYIFLTSRDDFPEDIAYLIAKTAFEHHDEFKKSNSPSVWYFVFGIWYEIYDAIGLCQNTKH